jgi:hypothetical protein
MNPPPKPSTFVKVMLGINVYNLVRYAIYVGIETGEQQELDAILLLINLGIVCWLWPMYWRERDQWKLYKRWIERSRE